MNNYLVRLIRFIGVHERHSHYLVQASNKYIAGTKAIEKECINKPVWDDASKQECVDNNEFIYRVDNVASLNAQDYELLSKLFS